MNITDVTSNPKFVIVMGGGGSGKNYFIANDPELRRYKMVDVDAIKGELGVENAIKSIKPMLEQAFKERIDVVHPTTGSNLKGQLNKIALAKEYGYRVIIILQKTDPLVAVQRVANRVALGGHDVNYDAIIASNEKARINFEQLRGLVDESYVNESK